jgi:hypothetical protein
MLTHRIRTRIRTRIRLRIRIRFRKRVRLRDRFEKVTYTTAYPVVCTKPQIVESTTYTNLRERGFRVEQFYTCEVLSTIGVGLPRGGSPQKHVLFQ